MSTIFEQTCPIWFEEGASKHIGEKALEYHASRVFCICDKGISSCGIASELVGHLTNSGLEVYLYDGVLPDAPDTMIDEIADLARSFRTDLVIGIGGGSSLDASKAIALLMDNPGSIRNYYLSLGVSTKESTPLFCIPTAAGTGSEATNICVVHDTQRDCKDTIIKKASLAIVDPELMIGLPPFITAITAFDALCHAIEAYSTLEPNPHSDALALYSIKLITQNIERACFNGKDINARSNLAKASTLAGIAFNDASVHAGHAIAHELGVRFHIPHGLACALTLPTILMYIGDVLPQRMLDIAQAMGIPLQEASTGKEAAALADSHIRLLMEELQIPSLKAKNYTEAEIVDCAEDACKNAAFIIFSPTQLGVPELSALLKDMYNRYQ